MIKLTLTSGDLVYVNPDHIDNIFISTGDNTEIVTVKDDFTVIESPEEVVRKIMEYKLAMTQYTSLSIAWASEIDPDIADRWHEAMKSTQDEIEFLAGLEDSDA